MRERLVVVLLGLFIGLMAAPAAFAQPEAASAAFAQQEGEALFGTLRGPDDEPVEGVTITVSQDGEQIGEATTDESGSWRVEVPSPGDYDVALDTDSLPQGVALDDEERATLEDVTVQPGDEQIVLFPLTSPGDAGGGQDGGGTGTPGATSPPAAGQGGDGTGWGTTGQVLQRLVAGIKFGAIIAITSIGLSLIFGTTGLINFAHGELVVIGAVVAYFFNAAPLGPQLHLIPAAIIAVVIGVMFGAVVERGLWRPLRGRGTGRIQLFIISIGLSLFLRHIVLWFFGSSPQSYAQYSLQESLNLGPLSITPRDLTITVVSVLVLVGVGLMLQQTRIGKAMRAVADNRDLAESSGIDVGRVLLFVWMLGSGLAALGGIMFGLTETISWDMGFILLLLMFAGVILGGLGTAFGAMAGGFLIGIIAQMSTLVSPVELRNAWALGVLIIVLIFRPQGLFGRAERVG